MIAPAGHRPWLMVGHKVKDLLRPARTSIYHSDTYAKCAASGTSLAHRTHIIAIVDKPRSLIAALCFLGTAVSPIAHALPGELYVSASPLVLKVALGGGTSPFSIGTLLPTGVALDKSGNLFTADSLLNRIVKLTPAGVQTTFLSSGLNSPRGLAFGPDGNLYVANSGSNSVLQVTPGAVVTTFVSDLNAPRGIAFDILGNLYVASSGDNSIVKVAPDQTATTFSLRPQGH